MDRDLLQKFAKVVRGFLKENKDLSRKEMSDMLRTLCVYYLDSSLSSGELNGTCEDSVTELSKDCIDDFNDMWGEFVQKVIDYVNGHPDVLKKIEELKEIENKQINFDVKDDKYRLEPDISLSFGIDGLESSIKEGQWSAGSDSQIGLYVGNKSVIVIC